MKVKGCRSAKGRTLQLTTQIQHATRPSTHLSFSCADYDVNSIRFMKLKLTTLVLSPKKSNSITDNWRGKGREKRKWPLLLLVGGVEDDCLFTFIAVSLQLVTEDTLHCAAFERCSHFLNGVGHCHVLKRENTDIN